MQQLGSRLQWMHTLSCPEKFTREGLNVASLHMPGPLRNCRHVVPRR